MEKQSFVRKNDIPYIVKKHGGSKQIRLSVRADGSVLVTVPRWVSKKQGKIFFEQHFHWVIGKLQSLPSADIEQQNRRNEYARYKQESLKFVTQRLGYFNTQYQFKYQRVSIRNTKTRWGSCSKQGNLNFHYKIVLLPARLADYIIVHELCHLRELNHSQAFWSLVGKSIPDYAVRKQALRAIRNV